jgi:antitoxin component YwqK of YwqJK toxin-antitoxin module
MKFQLVIYLLTLIACDTFAQDSTNKSFYPNGQLRGFHIKKDSVTVYEKVFYENGSTNGEGIARLIKGKYRPIQYKSFYEDGSIKVLTCDTSTTIYNPDGKISSHFQLINGLKNGNSFFYLEDKLYITIQFKNDKRDGLLISYDLDTGKKSLVETYKNDKKFGSTKHFDKSGRITKEIYYDDDCPVRAIYLDKNGKVTKTLKTKQEVWLQEGKPLNCK